MTGIVATNLAYGPTTPADAATPTGAVARSAAALPSAGSVAPPAPLYAALGSAFGTGLYGLRAPGNPEDAAMILAQVALALDATNTESRRQALEGALGGLRNGLGRIGALIIGASAQVAETTRLKAAQETKLDTALTTQAELAAEHLRLEGVIAAATRTIADTEADLDADRGALDAVGRDGARLDDRIDGLTRTIADLDVQIRAAEAAGDTDGARRLRAERSGVSDRLGTATAERAELTRQGTDLAGVIAGLEIDLAAARSTLDADKASLAAVETRADAAVRDAAEARGEIARYTAEIAALGNLGRALGQAVALVFGQLALAVRDGAGDPAVRQAADANLQHILDEADDALAALGRAQVARGEAAARTDDETLSERERREARRGAAPDASETRRITGLALGLAAGLADLLDALAAVDEDDAPSVPAPASEPAPYRLAI